MVLLIFYHLLVWKIQMLNVFFNQMKFKILLDLDAYLEKELQEKKNPLKNFYAMVKLNPLALVLKRSRIKKQKRAIHKKALKVKLLKENKWKEKENTTKKKNIKKKRKFETCN